MSLVSKVGRKRPRARLAMGILYLILTLGALTTLYPFALMLSTGFKGATDQNDSALIPKFLGQESELLTKYLDDKYASDLGLIKSTRIGEAAPAVEIGRYEKFLTELPINLWLAGFRTAPNQVTSRLSAKYQEWLRAKFATIDDLNKAYVEENIAFQTVQPPAEQLDRKTWKPVAGQKYEDWKIFKATLPAEYRIPIRVERSWQEFLKGKYRNQFKDLDKTIAGSATDFDSVKSAPDSSLWKEFLETRLPAAYLTDNAEVRWKQVSAFPLPIAAYEQGFLAKNASTIKGEFAGRNFRYVLDYILINGRAVQNTVIFCVLAILTQLIVNPIAAYALSRYPVKASGKILIFLLATMAFPAEVAMIPSFLLLKDLGLLNTFAALILPSAASGYMIFLLKGFFDSLPQELFEAGQLDGAKETTLMMRVAMPLSRPVLGYLALLAFMASYSTFIYAFLVIQDQKMWTLMVWIYQLQTTAPKAVVMAALTLAALPTLVVFLAAQRVILRGIVLPGER